MTLHIKSGSTWKAVAQPYIKVGSTWKAAQEVWIKVGATWKLAWSSGSGGGGSATFSPVPGSYSFAEDGVASFTVTASASVTWNWSATSSVGLTASRNSGTAGTSIVFSLSPPSKAGLSRATSITLTVGTSTWAIDLTANSI